MAYTVLARRYRSATFDDLIGQDHVARPLKRALESGRIAHAFLFCGTRGTGKTSSARILAKCLNCESDDKPVTKPCGKCKSCLGIDAGSDMDVIEIDAASNTGVDDVRDIIMNAALGTARSRFKVYIIDEVHMLSKNAFNALLKIIEEPPAHVKFILATTEPEKVLPTILSRCQRYDFRNIPTREIAGHLKAICKAEKIDADDDALLLVARTGAGSMRDALSLLDRLLSLGEKKVTADLIEQVLGLPKSQLLFDLAEAIGTGDTKTTLQQADAIVNGGLSPDSLIAALVDHLRNLLILSTCGPESELVEVPGLPLKDLVEQAGRFDAVALSQDIAILEELRRTLRTSQAGRALLDATLVRLALAEQFMSVDGAAASNGASRATPPAQKKKPIEPVAISPPVSVQPSVAPVVETPTESPSQPAEPAVDLNNIDLGDDDSLPSVGRVWEGPAPSLSTIMSRKSTVPALAPSAAPAASNVEPVAAGELPQTWLAILGLLSQVSHGLHGIVSQGGLARIDEGRAVIRFPSGKESFIKLLERNGKKEAVANAFTKVLRRDVGVIFEIDDTLPASATAAPTVAETPSPQKPAPIAPRLASLPPAPTAPEPQGIRLTQEMKDNFYRDEPLVRAIVDTLGGDIVKVEDR